MSGERTILGQFWNDVTTFVVGLFTFTDDKITKIDLPTADQSVEDASNSSTLFPNLPAFSKTDQPRYVIDSVKLNLEDQIKPSNIEISSLFPQNGSLS